ncbi:MAG TPA: zinc ribbon domain-containing protein [Acidobacteriaceae bacterium]|nr:zinc ribbon domain-containing protein [Acidobacteriaceae bacterium]
MPLYEYRCKNCGHQFEKIQSFSAPDEKECPVCQGPLERLISAPAIQFKGSGFYINDYASKGSSMKASSDGHKSGDSKSGESKSGDSKSGESSGDKAASKPATNTGSSSGSPPSTTTSSSSKSD